MLNIMPSVGRGHTLLELRKHDTKRKSLSATLSTGLRFRSLLSMERPLEFFTPITYFVKWRTNLVIAIFCRTKFAF